MHYLKLLILGSLLMTALNISKARNILSLADLYEPETLTQTLDQQKSVWIKAYVSNQGQLSCSATYCGGTDKQFNLESGDTVLFRNNLNLRGHLHDAARNLTIYFNRDGEPEQVPAFFNEDWDKLHHVTENTQAEVEIYADKVAGIIVKYDPATGRETYINSNLGYGVVIENGVEKAFHEPVQSNIQAYADRQTGEIVLRIDKSLLTDEMRAEFARNYTPVEPETAFPADQLATLKQKVQIYKSKYFPDSIPSPEANRKTFYGGKRYLFQLKPTLVRSIHSNRINTQRLGVLWELLAIEETSQDNPPSFSGTLSATTLALTGPPQWLNPESVTPPSKIYQPSLLMTEGYIITLENPCHCPEGVICKPCGIPYLLFASFYKFIPDLKSQTLAIYPDEHMWRVLLPDGEDRQDYLHKKYRILLETKTTFNSDNNLINLQQSTYMVGIQSVD